MAVVCLLALLPAAPAEARNLFSTEIPNGATHDCGACHIDIDRALNLTWFGVDVALTYDDYVNPKPIWPAVYALDSDDDGQTNGEELGDPCGEWTYGQDAAFEETSNPGDDLSVLEELPVYECADISDDDDSAGEDEAPASCVYSLAGDVSAPWPSYLLILWLLVRRTPPPRGAHR